MPDIEALLAQDDALLARLALQGPMNLPRAYEVMERFGVDGIVVGDSLNVFHMLGYWPQIASTKLGQPPTTFAILPRDPRLGPAVVTSHFIYYYSFADGGSRGDIRAYLFEGVADEGDDAVVHADPLFFVDKGDAVVTRVERRRRDETDRVLATDRLFAQAGGALAYALKDLGLWDGTLAYDNPVVPAVCERRGRPGTLVPADNLLRWIRIVKSPLELDLMRRGAQANADAVDSVIAQVRKGAGYRDLRRLYEVECARRGNRPVFMTIDRVSSPLPSDRIEDGQSLFFDGVSHFQNYHGDYARTVFVGEPTRAAEREAQAAVRGWEAIRERLKPGMRYSEVGPIGAEALKAAGADHTMTFGPHSVGLMHTDEPCADIGGFYGKEDLVLEENMILSVDCPSLATGIGGSVHIEDLVVITRDGAVPIHTIADHVIKV